MGKPKEQKRKYIRKPKLIEDSVSISLRIGDALYESSGASVREALKKLERPHKIVTKGFLSVSSNGHTLNRVFMPAEMRRFLWPVSNDVNAKVLSIALK